MPESLATRCGSMSSSQQASMMAAEIESCPQPAHSVEMRAFVVAPRVADLVGGQRRVVQAGLGDVGHASSLCRGRPPDWGAAGCVRWRMAPAMKRAVIGVPS